MARPPKTGARTSNAKRTRPLRKPVSRTPSWLPPVATLGVIALVVIAFLAIRWATTPPPPTINSTSAAQVVTAITSLPASELEQVGPGSATNSIKAVTGAALTGPDGKPELFFYGAEFCPYCAAQRWPIIIALSRFGTFSGLQTTTSSSTIEFANTPTFTFRSATFTSQFVDFQSVELTDRDQNALQTPTSDQQALVAKYDGAGTIPFIDIGNRYVVSGATYSPSLLSGMTWQPVADALQQPGSPQAKAILGSANLITAAICRLTGDQPASVCSGASIQAIEAKLGPAR